MRGEKNVEIMEKAAHLKEDMDSTDYWNSFYREVDIIDESSFCGFVHGMIAPDSIVLDIGCGSGRDSFAFARKGYQVIGLDRSVEAIKKNSSIISDEHTTGMKLTFSNVDINDEDKLDNLIGKVVDRGIHNMQPVVAYMRFLLHSINEDSERILLKTLSKRLRAGDCIAAEFRTIEDEHRNKIYGNHYRRFVDSDKLLQLMEGCYGFELKFFAKGVGLSIYNDEDPFLARIIATKV
jgi:2-polyprenyl-3-methyl-5-hydroxy-6-metoxy-1,4-benzoquinol methylase